MLIIPAALATAEGEGRSGRELITAIAAGYEVQCRCARDFLPSTNARGFRSSPTYGILGCAATVAKLMGLDVRQTTNAITLAASFAGSLIEGQRVGAMDADFAEAQASRNAIWAATLAANAFAGAQTALEGEGGFYNAFTGNNRGELAYAFHGPLKADLLDVVADLGTRWEVLDVKLKIYPTPGFNQPVFWLAHDLVAEHHLDARRIERVTLEKNHLETLYPSPRFPRAIGKDGHPFGRTAFMQASTLVDGDYPVLQFYDPHAAPALGDMKVNTIRMAQCANEHWSQASTVVGFLVKEHGMSYRTGHQILALMMQRVADKGISPAQMKAAALEQAIEQYTGKRIAIPQATLDRLFDAMQCVRERKYRGGAAHERVLEHIVAAREALTRGRAVTTRLGAALDMAEHRLDGALSALRQEYGV